MGMTRSRRRIQLRILVLPALLAAVALASPADAATWGQSRSTHRSTPKVVKRAVTFPVRNVDRSALSCTSDGAPYEVKGHLVGPASTNGTEASGSPRSVTLYLHGLGTGEFLWSLDAAPGYDYAAAMARAGHASVVVDRLGYGASGHPDGNQTCLGADADVAHQIVGDLRAGDYVVEWGKAPSFEKVALAGHDIGGLIANLEAFSFADIGGLAVFGHTPQVSRQTFEQFYLNRSVCDAGGEPATAGGPGGYAYFGQATAEFRGTFFHSVEPAVGNLVSRLRGRDPCGDTASIIDALVLELKSLSRIRVPVLLVCGREDATTPDFACPYLKRRYAGSGDVSLSFVRNAGHALPLERTAPAFGRRVSKWLDHRGF
jgi:pimeloyl-ACP methyl ester carboxylesterase